MKNFDFYFIKNLLRFCITQLRRRNEMKENFDCRYCGTLVCFFISRGTTATRLCPVKSIAQSMVFEVLIYLLSVFGSCMLVKNFCHTVLRCRMPGHIHKQASSSSSSSLLRSSSVPPAHSVFFSLLLYARGHRKLKKEREKNKRMRNSVSDGQNHMYWIEKQTTGQKEKRNAEHSDDKEKEATSLHVFIGALSHCCCCWLPLLILSISFTADPILHTWSAREKRNVHIVRTIIHNSKIESTAHTPRRVWVCKAQPKQKRQKQNISHGKCLCLCRNSEYSECSLCHVCDCGCGGGDGGGGGDCVFAKYVRSLNGASHSNHCSGYVQLLMGMRNSTAALDVYSQFTQNICEWYGWACVCALRIWCK